MITLHNRAIAYILLNRLEEALADVNRLLESDPNHATALNTRGEIYRQMGRHKESLSDLNKSFGIKSYNTDMTYLRFGTCPNCKEYNTGFLYCHSCDSQLCQKWTSGNFEIDKFIKNAQINSKYYHKVIEFIPFNKLENIKQIGQGGFSTVYSATWIDGKRLYKYDINLLNCYCLANHSQ
ncbi:hypothetical protein C2G38_320853 [Gigaspora rosea]|uniref:Uncharacterized protein n=1 Tax=Gigaspora rosea TaxID=44941 RepID=A0A397VUC0_9GLOM|nr:hypothetical protein C2G38_320853 [Gigaspora rosea]